MPAVNKTKLVIVATLFGPPSGIVAAAIFLWGMWITRTDLILFLIFYVLTVVGLTAGFHRLFAHKSFECKRWFEASLAIAGCMAAQGPVSFWVATHRKHHVTSDTEDDPHSPNLFGKGFGAVVRGWWHAHMGWMLKGAFNDSLRHVSDLRRNRVVVWCDRHYFTWVVLGLALPAGIGGLIGGDFESALRGFVWGGLVRMFLVHHVTWSINSLCHMFGEQPHDNGDESRNNWLCAIFSFGEGWHNNHHACPSSARHGFLPGQFDLTYLIIRALQSIRVVWGVRLPKDIQVKPQE
jgi:stearoyl-CoA desaturase (delta-9 desaturase)